MMIEWETAEATVHHPDAISAFVAVLTSHSHHTNGDTVSLRGVMCCRRLDHTRRSLASLAHRLCEGGTAEAADSCRNNFVRQRVELPLDLKKKKRTYTGHNDRRRYLVSQDQPAPASPL